MNSTVSDNYVDSSFTGSTSSGLGGKSLGHVTLHHFLMTASSSFAISQSLSRAKMHGVRTDKHDGRYDF